MNILIVDDHKIILESIGNALEMVKYIKVLGSYTNTQDLIAKLEKQQEVDIILLDYKLSEGSTYELCEYLTYHHPNIKIIILTGENDPSLCMKMIEVGCKGFIFKSSADINLIIEALNDVFNNKLYIDPSVQLHLSVVNPQKLNQQNKAVKLTKRELEIAQCLAEGMTSQEIAKKLYISRFTVDNHRKSILIKTGANNTPDLVRFLLNRKLVAPNSY